MPKEKEKYLRKKPFLRKRYLSISSLIKSKSVDENDHQTDWGISRRDANSALPSKNAVSAYQMKYKLLPFTLEEICRNEQTINSLS